MEKNIYQKLQECRVELQEMSIKKSGKNNFAGYSYFELHDILPVINKMFLDRQMTSIISFDNDLATLRIINAEKPEEEIIFTSPMRELQLKGTNAIQNLGGVETYQRRYLYLVALEIVENDMFDGQKPMDPVKTVGQAELDLLFGFDLPKEQAISILKRFGYTSSKNIKQTDFDMIMREFEKASDLARE